MGNLLTTCILIYIFYVLDSESCGLLLIWEDSNGFTSIFMGKISNIKFRGKSWDDVNCYYAVLLYEGMSAGVYKHLVSSKVSEEWCQWKSMNILCIIFVNNIFYLYSDIHESSFFPYLTSLLWFNNIFNGIRAN